MHHTRAAILLAVYAVMGVLAFPGLDFVRRGDLRTEADRAELRAEAGPAVTSVAVAIVDANRALRLPIEDLFSPLERVFRIKQSWSLYRDGPHRVERLEIHADGELLYRSASVDVLGIDPALSSRRMRPPVESTVRKRAGGDNWRGVARYVVLQVRAARPRAREIVLTATTDRFPGTEPTIKHQFAASAPEWEPWPR